jgi:UDP-N-acetyl-D-mannosaminuronate dehydrogenase
MSVLFAREGAKVVGVDIDAEALRQRRRSSATRVAAA